MQRVPSQRGFDQCSVALNNNSNRKENIFQLPLKYENLYALAQQQETQPGQIQLTEKCDFFSIIQLSKIHEVTTPEHYLGWKLHLSVDPQRLQEAFDLAAPIISRYGFFFKVINLDNKNLGERFKEGMQITIPLEELEIPVQSSDVVRKMMREIDQVFLDNQIYSGEIPRSDAQTFSSYFSMRNDKASNMVGKRVIEYIPASANFNPANKMNPFEDLLSLQPVPFDPCQHFLSLNVNLRDNKALTYLQITLLSYVREYTSFEMMNDQDKETFMYQYCSQDGQNLRAEFLKNEYKNNPQILLAVQQAFALIVRYEMDSSWMKGRYYEYVNSAQLSQQYSYDDSFKKLILLVEQHAKVLPEMHQFMHGEQKRSLLDLYLEKTNVMQDATL